MSGGNTRAVAALQKPGSLPKNLFCVAAAARWSHKGRQQPPSSLLTFASHKSCTRTKKTNQPAPAYLPFGNSILLQQQLTNPAALQGCFAQIPWQPDQVQHGC